MSGNCTNRPNDNSEEARSTPRDLQNQGSRNSQVTLQMHWTTGKWVSLSRLRTIDTMKIGVVINTPGLMKDIIDIIHQITIIHQPSPIGPIPGQDLSTTLIDLANIQSRSLESMVAN